MEKYTKSNSLAILTWKAPKTLENTLVSLLPLLSLFDDLIVVCQESDPEEMQLAKKYGFRPIGLRQNIGIQFGLKFAVESCAHEQILLLENDCALVKSPKQAINALTILSDFIKQGIIDFARVGIVQDQPRNKFLKYWSFQQKEIRRSLWGWIRYSTSNSIASEAISFPLMKGFNSNALKEVHSGIYLTDSMFCPWSNRSVFVSKNFFLGHLIPFAEKYPTSRRCNGLPELEHSINSFWRRKWWRNQRFKIGMHKPGLFGHIRLDRSLCDDKWLNGGCVNNYFDP